MDAELKIEDFEAVYEVSHSNEYGFGGNSTILLAVIEETEDKLIGYEYSLMTGSLSQATVVKSNVASWIKSNSAYIDLQHNLSED